MHQLWPENSWARRLRENRLFLYGLIGSVAALIDLGLFVLLHELAQWPALVAHSISIPVSAIFSFVGNARFNFRTTDRLASRFASFASVVALGYLLGAAVISVFVDQTPFGGSFGKVVSLPIVFGFQFILNSRISFRNPDAA